MAERVATGVAGLDRFDDFDTTSCDRRCSTGANPLSDRSSRVGSPSSWRPCGCSVDSLEIVMTLHLGLEYNLMDQYLVSLSSLLERARKEAENKR